MKTVLKGFALVSLLAMFFCSNASSKTIRVPADSSTIQKGINGAVNGDTVLVSDGTYVENIDFKGKAIRVSSVNGADLTIIDGKNSNYTVKFDASETSASMLRGFTVKGGKNFGIYVGNAEPAIQNCKIVSNLNGVYVLRENGGDFIKNNSFEANTDWPVQLHPGSVDSVVANNTFVRNVPNHYNAFLIIEGNNSGVITESTTWPVPPDSFCYLFATDHNVIIQSAPAPVLTLRRGTVVKMLTSTIQVGGNGTNQYGKLVARGVTFT